MNRSDLPAHVVKDQPTASSETPPGALGWITPELIRRTIETWQPYQEQMLTEDDALRILLEVGHLLDLLDGPDE